MFLFILHISKQTNALQVILLPFSLLDGKKAKNALEQLIQLMMMMMMTTTVLY